jgi:hypothetical protein
MMERVQVMMKLKMMTLAMEMVVERVAEIQAAMVSLMQKQVGAKKLCHSFRWHKLAPSSQAGTGDKETQPIPTSHSPGRMTLIDYEQKLEH